MANIYEFNTDALPGACRVIAFTGAEAVSTLYTVEAWLLAPVEEAVDADALADADATLRIAREDGTDRMLLHGVISDAEHVQSGALYALYRTVVRPRMFRMSLNEHSRVWVDKKFPDILEELLKASGMSAGEDYDLSLSGRYPVMEHICQYHESDFDFVSRWLEREGIHYFFQQGDAKEKVIFADDPGAHERSIPDPVRYFPTGPNDTSAVEALHTFRRRTQMRPEKVTLKDHDYLKPQLDLSGEDPVVDGGVGVIQSFGQNLPTPAEATRLAKARAKEWATDHVEFHGGGRVFELRPGYLFELTDHPRGSLNAEYLVTRLTHRGVSLADTNEFASFMSVLSSDERFRGATEYRAELAAVAADCVLRPARKTQWPRIRGIEAAVADGPLGDDYAEVDEHGRYHVKVRFDESDLSDGKASCWIRMVQPHAGNPEGFHFPLRKGTEVMLAFVGGDPDRPVIVGAVPDAQTPSSVTSSNHTQNVVMTGGRNRIEIEDTDGSQYVGVYSPTQNSSLHLGATGGPYHNGHNFTVTTDGTGLVHTGGNRDVTVGGDQTEDVQGNLTEDYHSTQTTHVFAAFDETIDGGATQVISAGETRTVTGGVTETISGGETRTINGGQTETVNGSVSRTVSASLTDTIRASVTESIGAAYTQTITGALTQSVASGHTLTTPAATITATGGMTVTAPGGFHVVAPGGITFIDSFIEMSGTKHEGQSDFKNEAGIMKYEIVGMAICYAGIKSEFTGAASAAAGAEGKTEIIKMLQAALKNDSGPAHVNLTGANPNT